MEVEHLATLERLRQNQRQDYLKVRSWDEREHEQQLERLTID